MGLILRSKRTKALYCCYGHCGKAQDKQDAVSERRPRGAGETEASSGRSVFRSGEDKFPGTTQDDLSRPPPSWATTGPGAKLTASSVLRGTQSSKGSRLKKGRKVPDKKKSITQSGVNFLLLITTKTDLKTNQL